MYRPYGDEPNQELTAGDASSKPLTAKERSAVQLALMTQAAMNKPPTGLAQLANNALNDPTVKTIMYLLGLPETVITSLAAAVRNPGALPAKDLAKSTFDRLQKGYTYADLYKTAGYNPGTAELLGLGASLTSPTGDKATAVRAAQGAMKAGADALAAADKSGAIGKNLVAQTLINAGYPARAADNAERALAGFTSGENSRLWMGLSTYWRYNKQNPLGPFHALGQTQNMTSSHGMAGIPIASKTDIPLDPDTFEMDLKVVEAGVNYFKEAARQGQKIYIYRSAPNIGSSATTGHSAQGTNGTFFAIDPHIAFSYALGNAGGSQIVEAAIDPKKVLVLKPKIIRSDDPNFLSEAYIAEGQLDIIQTQQKSLERSKRIVAEIDASLKPVYQTILEWGEKIKKDSNPNARSVEVSLPPKLLALVQKAETDAPGSIMSTIPQRIRYEDLVGWHTSMIESRRRISADIVDKQEQIKYLQTRYSSSGLKAFADRAKEGGTGKYAVMMTPQWDEAAEEARSKGYDAVFNPTTGEVVVLNTPRGKKPAPIQQVMSTARVHQNLQGANINYPADVAVPIRQLPFDSATQYPIPLSRSETGTHWQGKMDNVPSILDLVNNPGLLANANIDPAEAYRRFQILKAATEEARKSGSGGLMYNLWFEIATGMPYQEWLKKQK